MESSPGPSRDGRAGGMRSHSRGAGCPREETLINLEHFRATSSVGGILPTRLLFAVAVQWCGSEARSLTYKDRARRLATDIAPERVRRINRSTLEELAKNHPIDDTIGAS